uniref:Uncharacterized protein n=1 Tax=Cacopsylla melanoneura TaxID=428564 RepID=A0A8D8VFL7_9HEMI
MAVFDGLRLAVLSTLYGLVFSSFFAVAKTSPFRVSVMLYYGIHLFVAFHYLSPTLIFQEMSPKFLSLFSVVLYSTPNLIFLYSLIYLCPYYPRLLSLFSSPFCFLHSLFQFHLLPPNPQRSPCVYYLANIE